MSKTKQITNFDRYKVIPRTLIFIFDRENNVLLIRGSQTKELFSGFYNGIGGHIELGEDILEGAQRELAEEVGLRNIRLHLCGQIMIDVSVEIGVALFIFKGFYKDEALKSSKEGEYVWVPISELSKYPVIEDLSELIPKIFDHQLSEQLIIGKYQTDSSGNRIISFSK
jgi:8-oxo-dGTP diphosphatase